MDPKISSIIKKNDELINLLDSLRQQNEKELILYKEVNNSMPWQVAKMNAFRYSKIATTEKEKSEEEIAEEKARERAALIIQRAYRKHLFKVQCDRRLQSWEHVGIPDRIKFIEKISTNSSKINVISNFDPRHWKEKLNEFEKNRSNRTKSFEKKRRSLDILKKEQNFIRDDTDSDELPKLKPYLLQKASEEMRYTMDRLEMESLLSLL